jgi:hypothetical protein
MAANPAHSRDNLNKFQPQFSTLPPAQRQLWPELKPISGFGFVLYGGTSIALRLGHRTSVDFDFFNSAPIDPKRLRKALPFLGRSTVLQDHENTFEVLTESGVKVSFFGGLDFGRVNDPEITDDGTLVVASLDDLMATKVKVILQRSESKDYRDVAAMIRAGTSVAAGLAAAEQMYRPTFPVIHALKALTYFEGGDLTRLPVQDRNELVAAARRITTPLPNVTVCRDLSRGVPPAAFDLR